MKKLIAIFVLTTVMLPASLASDQQSEEKATKEYQRWSKQKAQDWYQQQPWLVGCNFIPSTAINQLEMWQNDTFDADTIDRELGWAESIGMNTIRVYLHDLLWTQDSEGFLKQIDRFLGICKKRHIKPMFVLFDSVWNPHPQLGKQPEPRPHVHNSGWVQSPHIDVLSDPEKIDALEPYVRGVMERFKNDSRVLMWDLYNEPGNRNEKEDGTSKDHKSLVLLKKVFRWARQVNPSQPLTAGLWKDDWQKDKLSELNQHMLDHSDLITFHSYTGLDITIDRVNQLKSYGRPLICTEYMARTNGSRFAEHLPLFKEHHIGAYNWGLVAGKTQTQYPWESWKKKFTKEPEIWFHDIFHPDGRPYDLAEVELIKKLTADETFVNPLYDGADPFVYKHTDGFYYFCQSGNDQRILVWKSDELTDKGVKKVIWQCPPTGWNTSGLWAPELHYLNGTWFIYYAATDGPNANHRIGVLQSIADDPQGTYIDKGVVYTGDHIDTIKDNRWAIDATPLEMGGKLYLIWSGWHSVHDIQSLYIAEMENPWTTKTNRVKIAENNTYDWEKLLDDPDQKGLNEGPQILKNKRKIYLIYSCSGSWQVTYKLGQLSIDETADPMNPENWIKKNRPVFQGSETVYGVGHASFTTSPDDNENWIVYHSKQSIKPGWKRNVRMQKFSFNADGSPNFGIPVEAQVPLPKPSGEK